MYIDGKTIRGNYTILLDRATSLVSQIRHLHEAKTADPSSDQALLDKCKRLAEAVACHTVFPYCSPSNGHEEPTPRNVCKNTCDAFRVGGICESFVSSETTSPSFYNNLMANCDERESPAGDSPECIPVSAEPTKGLGKLPNKV